MEYNIVEEKFNIYIEKCKEIIKNTFFKEEDLEDLKLDDSLGITGTIRKHRLNMIDIKLNHTMRMIEQIIKINEILDLKFDFQLVMKVAVLYHDIGRMSQATWSNTFSDTVYSKKNKLFKNHGDEGKDIFLNNNFEVDKQFKPLIGESILYHVNVHEVPQMQYRYDTDIRKINIGDIITGNIILNEAECQVASLITQLVADIDKTDILYQYLSGDIDLVRDYVIDDSNDTLDNISKKWGISKEEIIEYNQIDKLNYTNKSIKIPVKNMEISKLAVPERMKEMFYNNTWLELNELKKDPNWNFITILWWRLSHFLNNINFYSVLATIEETKLLDNIEKKIPDKFKPLTQEAFDYAKEALVYNTLKQNQENIYIKKGSR